MEIEQGYRPSETSLAESDWANYDRLKELKREHFLTLTTEQKLHYFDIPVAKNQMLKEKYPHIKSDEVLLWHLMCGSTPDKEKICHYDYPEGEITDIIITELGLDPIEPDTSQV